MHTSAHPSQTTPQLMEYSGTLTDHAQARAKTLDHDGTTVPVLCMDIELDNALHTPMHVEQPFAVNAMAQAKAAAHRLKKGMRVTVQAPLVGHRLVACNVAHIHVINHQPEVQP